MSALRRTGPKRLWSPKGGQPLRQQMNGKDAAPGAQTADPALSQAGWKRFCMGSLLSERPHREQ